MRTIAGLVGVVTEDLGHWEALAALGIASSVALKLTRVCLESLF
jgi:hypothetical protein